ncbi:beta-lactamase family protein [Paenibacillus sp. IB182496]|uniref:Beta-lactamase family protein n=1 Tax=Paenibacillus sabuli TaxID=2772509 RepID=A0A927BW72_9BACL|nr:serine hydrolase domain-containing protein [Paenibacillus sabuli]MBD2846594.1 beta-lactamase family protein [Paenibacillus sabuli]
MNFEPLAAYLDRITAWRIPWAEVCVMHGDETVFRCRSGFEDLEARTPIGVDRIINLYSMTKIMTCAAGLQLMERGAFLLNDPLSAYLPEYAEMTIRHDVSGSAPALARATRPIRIRDLFAMTAGFTYDLRSPALQEAAQRTGGRMPTRDFAAALAKEPLLFEPGTRWNYSLCHDVLAALVEVVDGRRFGQYVREEITGPLGMDDTGFDLPEAKKGRLVPQYTFNEERNKPVRKDGNGFRLGAEFESGGAGLLSTVDDYIRFLHALTNRGTGANGARILSPAAVELMRTDQLSEPMRADYNWEQLAGYGYGLGVRTHIARSASGLLSPHGEFGWSGAAGCMALIDPESRLTVMYAQHMLNSQEPHVHPRLKNLVYSGLGR